VRKAPVLLGPKAHFHGATLGLKFGKPLFLGRSAPESILEGTWQSYIAGPPGRSLRPRRSGRGPRATLCALLLPRALRRVAPARALTSGMLCAHSQAAAFAPLTGPPSARELNPKAWCAAPTAMRIMARGTRLPAACMAVDGMAGGGKPVAQAVRSILTSPDSKAVRKAMSTVCDFLERAKSEPSPRLLLAMLAACRATGEWRRAQTLLRKLRAATEQGSSSWVDEGASIAIGACARWGPEEVRYCWAQIFAPTR
jgi:hypothetical protein